MKLFGNTKQLIDKTKKRRKCAKSWSSSSSFSPIKLQDNQYQQKSEVLYTFTPNKSYAYFLNVEPSNSVFLKTYNTAFDEIIITFIYQNSRLLETEDKVNFTLLIRK